MKLALMLGLAMAASAGCGGGSAASGGPGPSGDPGTTPIVEASEGEGGGEGGQPPAGGEDPAGEPGGPSEPAGEAGGGPRGESAAILEAHNRVRAKHCARPLVWSEALAATAQEWANSLRDSGCRFEHSQTAYGENLAAGTRLSGENAVELWAAEVSQYDYKKPGFSPRTGHFTQMVWAGSRSLGCGFSECQGMRLWVCHYDPAGNVMTMFRDNVSPPTCK
jgi:hypothetical protein